VPSVSDISTGVDVPDLDQYGRPPNPNNQGYIPYVKPGPRFGKYDGDLQMFCEPPQPPNMERLAFLRWTLQHDHDQDGWIMGESSGEFAPPKEPEPSSPAPQYTGKS
jgi:hypothetical protein